MRVFLYIPDKLIPTIQDQARAAHRPPRYHLEWLLQQVLEQAAQKEHEQPQTAEVCVCSAERD